MIWYKKYNVEDIQWMLKNTLADHLGIEYVEIGEDSITATMPVDERTKQPFGICHGGAYVVLGEELGSIASFLVVNPELFVGVGVEVNANHVKAVTSGKIKGVCKPIHIKGKTHVWDIKLYDSTGDLCSVCRFTCQVVPKKTIEVK
ncbi:MAG: hotdog fold thioesterase [Bacteroidota bacterium]|nr:hotdog fold thioesterase [Bacteroidota bacterium]